MLFVKSLSATPSTTLCVHGAGNTKEKYPLNTSQKKSSIHSVQPMIILAGNIPLLSAAIHLYSMTGCLPPALSRLPLREREMLYLSFFKRIPQHEIGRRYRCSRSTAGYHIRKSIGRLYEEMEGMKYEE